MMCTCIVPTQRVYGFSICAGCAVCFGFLSTLFVVMPTKFAVLFTFSQVFAIARYAADALLGISCMQHGSSETSSSRSVAVQHLLFDGPLDTAEEHDEKGQVTGVCNVNAYVVESISDRPVAHSTVLLVCWVLYWYFNHLLSSQPPGRSDFERCNGTGG